MFGLKVIKESELASLRSKINTDEELISSLYATIAELTSKNQKLNDDVKKLKKDAEKKVELLVDVAETPLKKEKMKKTTKKMDNGKTVQRRAIHKVEK